MLLSKPLSLKMTDSSSRQAPNRNGGRPPDVDGEKPVSYMKRSENPNRGVYSSRVYNILI